MEKDPAAVMTNLTGKLLIAMPSLSNSVFERSVILLCQHSAEAAMGLIVNKIKPEISLGDVLEHLGIEVDDDVAQRAVLDGGPVKQDRGYVLHSADFDAGEATQAVAPGLKMTATRDVLEAMAQSEIAPREFVLALGYSGWGPGQLENELRHNAWLVTELDRDIVFDENAEDKWNRALKTMGLDAISLSGDAGRA